MESLPRELLEKVFISSEFKEILNFRLVCQLWDEEVLRIIRMRKCKRKGLVNWNHCNRGWIGSLKRMLRDTKNAFLFESCQLRREDRLEDLYQYIFPRYGHILKIVDLNLDSYTMCGVPVLNWEISNFLQNMFKLGGYCPNVSDLTLGAGEITCLCDSEIYDPRVSFMEKCKIKRLVLTDSFFILLREISTWLLRSQYLTEASLLVRKYYLFRNDRGVMEAGARQLMGRFKTFSEECKNTSCDLCQPIETTITLAYRNTSLSHIDYNPLTSSKVIERFSGKFCRHG